MKTLHSTALALTASLLAGHAFAQAPNTTTTTTTTPATAVVPAPSADVGVSSRDGITVSGTDVLITRNGLTQKLTQELELPNGFRVQPDGTVRTRDGGTVRLRATQVLGFDGQFIEAPVNEAAVVQPTTPILTVKPALTPQAATEAARVEAKRRAEAVTNAPIKAGEGVQK